jgi:hypothetical protein
LKKSAAINEQLQFEQMISNLSARFINLPSECIDKEIENALAGRVSGTHEDTHLHVLCLTVEWQF